MHTALRQIRKPVTQLEVEGSGSRLQPRTSAGFVSHQEEPIPVLTLLMTT